MKFALEKLVNIWKLSKFCKIKFIYALEMADPQISKWYSVLFFFCNDGRKLRIE